MIGIINYGASNLGSVANAFKYINIDAEIVENPDKVHEYSRLVLPGVGSFSVAMQNLNSSGWANAIRQKITEGVPLLGICLGMQLLFDEGEENEIAMGLGVIPGKVIPIKPSLDCIVPHIGWNSLIYGNYHPLFDSIKEHVDLYFVHSYQCIPAQKELVLATCDYADGFVASVGKKNVVGVQFHPEKSQDIGLKILENFSKWDGLC
jgi:glutamine amidotransferase